MFKFVQNNRTVVQIFLVLITLPFAFFGIESFVSGGGTDAVAEVASSKITRQELEASMREQQDRMRQQFGRDLPAGMLDSPEIRRAVLDTLVTQRTLAAHAAKSRLVVSDASLSETIQGIPAFQEDGKFSRRQYDAYVAAQGISQQEFERRLRQQISLQQMLGAVREAALPGEQSANRWIAAVQEIRQISESIAKPEQFVAQVSLSPDAIRKYYDDNPKSFETPEQLRAEYLVLSQDALMAETDVGDAEIAEAYQKNSERYRQKEERQASHILIGVAKDAPEAAVGAAQARAQDLLAALRKSPTAAEFARLAKQHSQDPGSAANGGDLGWFSRGMMVKAFDDAAFALKPNEISDVVRSDFGFHIIRLAAVKGGQTPPLQQVRGEILAELKRQAAAKKYAEIAEAFSNTVYEQADSLAPAAEKYKLTLRQSDWLDRNAGVGPLAHPKLTAALFGDDAIKNKRNTEAVEVGPNTLIAARVLEHKPAARFEFDKVRADIEKRLSREEAGRLARKEGEARLARLNRGETLDLAWTAPRDVTRATADGLATESLRAVYSANVAKLPAYAGATLADGSYAIYRISSVRPWVANADDARTKQLRQQYARIVADEELAAWLGALRQKYPAKIHAAALDSKEAK